MDSLLVKLFEFRDNIKLFHFQTPSFAAHTASDELEKTLTALIDQFIEEYQGSEGKRIEISTANITLKNHTRDIVQYAKSFSILLDKAFSLIEDQGLLNVLADFISAIDKFLYLLTFQ